MNHRFFLLPFFIAFFTIAHNPTSARAQTTTFQVTANVNASCSVAATNVAFGVYNPATTTPIDGTMTLDVTCTNGTTYNIAMNEGLGHQASVAERKMTSGSSTLIYSIYRNTQRTNVWGQTVGVDTATGTGTGTAQAYTGYARLVPLQNVAAGSYADTITVTVVY